MNLNELSYDDKILFIKKKGFFLVELENGYFAATTAENESSFKELLKQLKLKKINFDSTPPFKGIKFV